MGMGTGLYGTHTRPALICCVLAGMLAILALSGCASSSAARPAARTASTPSTATSTHTAHTATPASTHGATSTGTGTAAPTAPSSGASAGQPSATAAPGPGAPTGFAGAPCTAEAFTTHGETVAHLGDILLGQLDFNSGYPGYVLPDDLRLAPYQIGGDAIGSLPDLSNPANGVAFKLCNASATQAHVISAIAIRIDSFSGYAGHLNEIRLCAPVFSQQGMRGGGCGGGFPFDVTLAAAFAANASTGDVAAAGFTPITLSPGEEIVVGVTLTLPTTPGTYAFRGGIGLDGGAITYPAAPSTPALYAPVAHEWSGQNCTRPDMLAQIPPATIPPTYFICPSA
jgi:hypothetical protein